MKRNLLPIHQTGWLYLLIAGWALLYWIGCQGGFNWLNQFNRERLYQALPIQQSEQSVLRLSTALSQNNAKSIVELVRRMPEVPVVLIGDPSDGLLNHLTTQLSANARPAPVTVATGETVSAAQVILAGDSTPIFTAGLDWFRYAAPDKVQWRTSTQLVYAPLIHKPHGGLPVIWREQDKVYPTLIGEILRQTRVVTGAQFKAGWDLEFILNDQRWPLGMQGDIFSGGDLVLSRSLENFLSADSHITPEIIFLDDGTHPLANQVIRTTQRLMEHNYLYQTFVVKVLQWLLIAVGLVLFWLMRRIKTPYQGMILLGYLVVLWVVQYIAFTQMQWLAVAPISITLLLSWLVLLAYQSETRRVATINERHNQLLGEALPIFYHSQKIDRIQAMLAQTIPDIKLADKVFDVALQAEANNNRPLAKNLLSWIQDSGLKHTASAQKLGEFAEPEKAEQSLDSTMVIEPGQTPSQSMTVPALQIENFGRYKVEGILGKGAMGIVFQGVDPKINRHVAIKTLQLHDADNDSFNETKARFFREAETAGNLSHANIVTIYDVGEEGELGYIAMDLLTGAPLSEFVKPESRLPAPLVYQLMIQITDALDYAHRQNVVHRDIKPGNIIFDDEIQRVTLTDFGIAFVADHSKTRTGTIMGSPFYMSPEQVLGKRVDGRSDIFSLGVTFYQLLSGQLPFNGESIASVAYHITKSKQASVRQYDSKLPASAARITNKALQKDASKRYQTMDEFKQVLISALKRDYKKAPIV